MAARAAELGRAGSRWLDQLEGRISGLERDWAITVGSPLPGGTASYVAAARMADGRDAVLKLGVPDPDLANQVETLVRARGRGYCRVYRHSPERNAVLLERLGGSLEHRPPSPGAALDILCRTLQSAWQVEPWPALDLGAPGRKAHQLRALIEELWIRFDRPCSETVVDTALRYAERRAEASGRRRCVVVHGDPHPGNALRVGRPRPGAESGFVFVDPDGFLEDPAYDLGVVLRDWCADLQGSGAPGVARAYCRRLADRTGIDARDIWEWGFIERVSSGLYLMLLGDIAAGRRLLRSAEAIFPAD